MGLMRLQVERRGVGEQRERVWLLPSAVLSVGARALLELGPAVRGHWRRVGSGVLVAQTLVCPQGPAPPAQLGLERLDLPPKCVVVPLQRLILLVQSVRSVCVSLSAALGRHPARLLLL